jgi:homoserine O-acetyltransferase
MIAPLNPFEANPMLRSLTCFLAVMLATAVPAMAADGDRHAFVIKNFKLENDIVLPEAKVMYATYGTLNAARDNAVLLPSHYMADAHGYEWLIGPDKALDPKKYFLVATELFGNGKSSSPSNTPAPFDGPRFPVTSIRDNVAAVHRLLGDALGVRHLRAVIGFSMGGQQAFQWAVTYPNFMDRIVVTSATAKTWPHGIVRLESQIIAIESDPVFAGGDYKVQPKKGLQTFGAIWAGGCSRKDGGASNCGAQALHPARPSARCSTGSMRILSPVPMPTT